MSYTPLSELVEICFKADPDAKIDNEYLKKMFKHHLDIDISVGDYDEELTLGYGIAAHFSKLFEDRQMSAWTFLYMGAFIRFFFDNTEDAVYAKMIL